MKKLMIALSAVALAMGVNADVIKGTNLNDGDVSGFTDRDESQISETPFEASSGENVTDYKSEPPEKNLAIKTKLDAPAYYTLDEAASMDGTFFDSMVKFTYCDEDAAVPAESNAKLMVWVKETEAEGATAGKTNLMITAGYFTTSGLNAKIYDCGPISGYGIAGADDWARLTIKSIPDITAGEDGFPGFNVYVNTKLAKVIADKAIGDEGSRADSLTRVANEMKKGDYLFPSMIQDQDAQLQGVGFAGQGAIDNIAFTTTTLTDKEGLPFTDDPIPAIAKVNGQECGDITAINNAISAAGEGAAVVLVYDVEGNLTFDNEKANTLELGGFTLDGGITVTTSDSLAINGTGTVTGEVSAWDADYVTINGGTFETTVGFADGIVNDGWFKDPTCVEDYVKAGFELKLDTADNYYKVVEKTYFSGGTGTEADPYIMGKEADLAELQGLVAGGETYAGKFFKQTADLDLNNEAWDGIGSYSKGSQTGSKSFAGTYDGNGKKIQNLKLTNGKYKGLFNSVWGVDETHKAVIKNLTVENFGMVGGDGEYGMAALVGGAVNAELIGLTADGMSSTTFTHNSAGIAVHVNGHCTLKDCTNNVDIAVTGEAKAAGICAVLQGSDDQILENCANTGNITGDEEGAGGLIDYCNTAVTIKNCSNTGVITATSGEGTNEIKSQFVNYGENNKVRTLEGVNTALASDVPVFGHNQVVPNFGESDGSTITFPVTPAVGGTYIALGKTAKPVVTLGKDDSLTINWNGFTADKSGITVGETGYQLKEEGTGIVTYSLEAETYTITYVYKANDVEIAAKDIAGLVNSNPESYTVENAITISAANITATDFDVANVDNEGWAVGAQTGDVTVTVTLIEKAGPTPIDPDPTKPTEIEAQDKEAAEAKAAMMDVNGRPTVEGLDQTKWNAYFDKTVSEGKDATHWNVTATLKPEIVKAEAETTTVAAKLGDIAAAESGAVDVSITGAKPGLWYSLYEGAKLDDTRVEGNRAMADKDGKVTLNATHYDGSGFYQIKVNVTNKQ